MAAAKKSGYRDYTADSTYWTVRKHGKVFWVVRIDLSGGTYHWKEIWGGYHSAGAAAQLAYGQGQRDAVEALRGTLHAALDGVGLGVPPTAPPVRPDAAKDLPLDDEDEDDADG